MKSISFRGKMAVTLVVAAGAVLSCIGAPFFILVLMRRPRRA